MKYSYAIVLLAGTLFSFSCSEENNIEPEAPAKVVKANYEQTESTVFENATTVLQRINLSEAAQGQGSVKIQLNSLNAVYGEDYVTQPSSLNGQIELIVEAGDVEVTFEIQWHNNALVDDEATVQFVIFETTGLVEKGDLLEFTLTVQDDELLAKPKTSQSSGLNQTSKTFEYDVNARLAKIHWESRNPFQTKTGTDIYRYNVQGELTAIEKGEVLQFLYTWENGRIVKQERMQNGRVDLYQLFTYNTEGKLIKSEAYSRQPQVDNFSYASTTDYAYLPDGNVHIILVYNDEAVIRKTTYLNYTEGYNPFSTGEVLPNLSLQTKLPTAYVVESGGATLEYTVNYTLREDGLPVEKIVSGAAAEAGTTLFSYY